MTPLNLSPHSAPVPEDHLGLLRLLAERPGPAVVWHRHDAQTSSRVELSGRVLENWAVKMIGLFDDELSLEHDDVVLVDAAPHWKAAAAVLAASTLGCRVRLSSGAGDDAGPMRQDADEPALVITDAPRRWEDPGVLGDAELAVLSPGLRDASFEEAVGTQIPSWALDLAAEVPQQPDQLISAPAPAPLPGGPTGPTRGSVITETDPPTLPGDAESDRPEWVARRWTDEDVVAVLLGTWARSGRVVLWQGPWADADGQPRPEWQRTAEEESVPSSPSARPAAD